MPRTSRSRQRSLHGSDFAAAMRDLRNDRAKPVDVKRAAFTQRFIDKALGRVATKSEER